MRQINVLNLRQKPRNQFTRHPGACARRAVVPPEPGDYPGGGGGGRGQEEGQRVRAGHQRRVLDETQGLVLPSGRV